MGGPSWARFAGWERASPWRSLSDFWHLSSAPWGCFVLTAESRRRAVWPRFAGPLHGVVPPDSCACLISRARFAENSKISPRRHGGTEKPTQGSSPARRAEKALHGFFSVPPCLRGQHPLVVDRHPSMGSFRRVRRTRHRGPVTWGYLPEKAYPASGFFLAPGMRPPPRFMGSFLRR